MTTQELITELHSSLGAASRDKSSFQDGLTQLVGQIELIRKDRLKKLKKATCKSKRKSLKRDLRRVERVLRKVS